MLDIAKKNAKIANKNTKFYFGNAESFRLNNQIDIVTCMFAFHEMPNYAHIRIIQNALMITKEEFVIVDIDVHIWKYKK